MSNKKSNRRDKKPSTDQWGEAMEINVWFKAAIPI
jgi:hypothetical protein